MANTCFVYRIGTKLGFKFWGVFLAALVWGLHPLHTEAVTYMSGTADPLFAFFCLWAIIIMLPDITPDKILKITPLFLLGLLSKETASMFPLLVMVCLFLTSKQRLNIRTYLRTWPLWIVMIVYVIWRLHATGFAGPQTYVRFYDMPEFSGNKLYAENPFYRIYIFLSTLPAYLGLLAWPHDLHLVRSVPLYTNLGNTSVLMGLGIALLVAAQIIRSFKKASYGIELSWGMLWFGAAYAPNSGILTPSNSLFYEHWMYLPSVGLFLGLAETLAKALQNRPRSFAIVCSFIVLVFLGVLSVKSYHQNKIWHDPVIFYNNIFRYYRGINSAGAHDNLGVYYLQQGLYDDALEQFKQAITLDDTLAEPYTNLAVTYFSMPDHDKRTEDIIQNFNRAMKLDPNSYHPALGLGYIYDYLGDKDKAKYYHDRADAILAQHQ